MPVAAAASWTSGPARSAFRFQRHRTDEIERRRLDRVRRRDCRALEWGTWYSSKCSGYSSGAMSSPRLETSRPSFIGYSSGCRKATNS